MTDQPTPETRRYWIAVGVPAADVDDHLGDALAHAADRVEAVLQEERGYKAAAWQTGRPDAEQPFVPRTEREYWQAIADALNDANRAGMPVGIDLDGTLTDHNAHSVVWNFKTERWDVAGYEDDDQAPAEREPSAVVTLRPAADPDEVTVTAESHGMNPARVAYGLRLAADEFDRRARAEGGEPIPYPFSPSAALLSAAREAVPAFTRALDGQPTAPGWTLTPDTLDTFLRALVNELDYDLHKAWESNEETGEDDYPKLVTEAGKMLDAITAPTVEDTSEAQSGSAYAAGLIEAARLAEQDRVPNPMGEAEEHVNDCFTTFAATLRRKAAEAQQ
ncbi:hypothetical protein ACIQ6R_18025 [Streptomyces sp. NPDC096048]|uniref:hypothetical protein n=1 Tax=Streptomyces sp. NPDC096048 TaxID=3366072 RepID=UPI0037FD6188